MAPVWYILMGWLGTVVEMAAGSIVVSSDGEKAKYDSFMIDIYTKYPPRDTLLPSTPNSE
jgi:hypothetical protein